MKLLLTAALLLVLFTGCSDNRTSAPIENSQVNTQKLQVEETKESNIEEKLVEINESENINSIEGKLIYILSSEHGGYHGRINSKNEVLDFIVDDKILIEEMQDWVGRIVKLEYLVKDELETRKNLLYKNNLATTCIFISR